MLVTGVGRRKVLTNVERVNTGGELDRDASWTVEGSFNTPVDEEAETDRCW